MSEPAAKPPERCRYCRGSVLWHDPGGLVFDDATIGHLSCFEAAETERQAARREQAKAVQGCPHNLEAADGQDATDEPGEDLA
jgi:hypothetical protein